MPTFFRGSASLLFAGLSCTAAFQAGSNHLAAHRFAQRLISRATGACLGLAKNGDLVRVKFAIYDPETNAPLKDEFANFDEGEVELVVGGGGYLLGVHRCVSELNAVGEPSTFEVSPAEAFGEADPAMQATVPQESCPPGLVIGDRVQLQTGMVARVSAVTDTAVTIDANHQMAGKKLMLTAELLAEPVAADTVLETATFAGGCFWGLELAFQREPGVVTTEVGYCQGEQDEPTYQQVCSGSTGHTEAVRVRFNPKVVSYQRLLDLFWERLGDNRFKLNQVGNDRGTQYRHGIYFHGERQQEAAEASLAAAKEAAAGKEIFTELLAAERFWEGEEYHQQYLQKGGQSAKKTATETIRCYG